MNKVRRKLFEAKKLIANTPTKKQGKNKFSNYDYFTPSQVSKLVFDACTEVGIVTGFNLLKEEGIYFGVLNIYDVDSDDQMIFQMATDMPEMKAANVTQQLGATATYVLRYLEQTTFGIVDNNLDPDTKDNRPNKGASKSLPASQFQKGADQVANGSLSISDFENKLSKFDLTDVQSKSLVLLKSTLV